jgi:hypothetical protein
MLENRKNSPGEPRALNEFEMTSAQEGAEAGVTCGQIGVPKAAAVIHKKDETSLRIRGAFIHIVRRYFFAGAFGRLMRLASSWYAPSVPAGS